MKRNLFFISLIITALLTTLLSCVSNKESFPVAEEVTAPVPPVMTVLPVLKYQGNGIKYEVENMLLYQFVVFPDATASGQYGAKLLDDSSTAQMKVHFPAGTYECLLSERAFDNNTAPFYVYLDNVPYRVYPSDPPLGEWELTTRAPIYFTIEEPRTILITIQANSEKRLGSTGCNLDYIQFVKR